MHLFGELGLGLEASCSPLGDMLLGATSSLGRALPGASSPACSVTFSAPPKEKYIRILCVILPSSLAST